VLDDLIDGIDHHTGYVALPGWVRPVVLLDDHHPTRPWRLCQQTFSMPTTAFAA
jgi:hypothetical protein